MLPFLECVGMLRSHRVSQDLPVLCPSCHTLFCMPSASAQAEMAIKSPYISTSAGAGLGLSMTRAVGQGMQWQACSTANPMTAASSVSCSCVAPWPVHQPLPPCLPCNPCSLWLHTATGKQLLPASLVRCTSVSGCHSVV